MLALCLESSAVENATEYVFYYSFTAGPYTNTGAAEELRLSEQFQVERNEQKSHKKTETNYTISIILSVIIEIQACTCTLKH